MNENFNNCQKLQEENERLKNMFEQISKEHCEINESYITNTDCLREIKEIAEENKDTVQYGGICRSILAIINKAEV